MEDARLTLIVAASVRTIKVLAEVSDFLAEARTDFQNWPRLSGAGILRLFWLMPEESFNFTAPVWRGGIYEFD